LRCARDPDKRRPDDSPPYARPREECVRIIAGTHSKKIYHVAIRSAHPCKPEDALYLPIQLQQRKKGGRRELLCDTLEKKPVGRIKSWVEVEKPQYKIYGVDHKNSRMAFLLSRQNSKGNYV
jgi:hypothetical protein